eukprot:Skav217805  [mRNA]  locus=scaffold1782:564480:566437:- [translate_table: standard]
MPIRGVLDDSDDGHSSEEESSWDRVGESADGQASGQVSWSEEGILTIERLKEEEEKVHKEWQKRESTADSAGEKERLNDWKKILDSHPWQKVKKAPADSASKAYEMLRSLGGELLGDAKRAVNQAVEHLKELRAAATVREETVQGILDSMVQDLRREEAPERCFCKERGFYSPIRVAELSETLLQQIDDDGEVSRQVRLVQGWIQRAKLAEEDSEACLKEAKSLETFLTALGDDYLGAKEGLKKEVDKQEPEWKTLARAPVTLKELQAWPRLVKIDRRKNCKDLVAWEVSALFADLKACWTQHRKTWPDKLIPADPPSLKAWFRGDLNAVDPLQNDKRVQALMEFFVRNAKWRERWDQVSISACVKRALRTAKDTACSFVHANGVLEPM